MQTFALDDNITRPKHLPVKSTTNQSSTKPTSSLFSWENLSSEESKNQFQKLPFGFDKYYLEPNTLKALKGNIKLAKKKIKEGKVIVIEGHSCHSAGSAIYNLTLSEKRAQHVARKLTESGVKASHIKIAPRGQEMPLIRNGNREEQAPNRRVEMFAIDTN